MEAHFGWRGASALRIKSVPIPALAAAFRLDEFLRDSDYRTRRGGAK